MKNIFKSSLLIFAALFAFSSCMVEVAKDGAEIALHEDNAIENYVINQVLEYDPMNPTGIDISKYVDEFSSITLTIYYEDGKMSAVEFNHGTLPYNPLAGQLPSGKVSCTYDSTVYPAVIKLSDGTVLAEMIYNEPVVKFSLDYSKISYQYSFKAAK